MEWNKIDIDIRNSASCTHFKKLILKFIRPVLNTVFNADIREGLKFLSRIRVRLSHSVDHKFKHSFQDCVNPICICSQKIEV